MPLVLIAWHIQETDKKFIMPPFEEEGAYCFANIGRSICPSVRLLVDHMISDHFLMFFITVLSYFTC